MGTELFCQRIGMQTWLCAFVLSLLFSANVRADSDDPATELAAVIDRRISEGWQRDQIEPAPQADDPEFLRRTYLNIVGRIPSVNEVLEFLDNPSPDRRRELVDQLLDSPGYLSNMTHLWRDAILPEASNSTPAFQQFGAVNQFDVWLRERLDRESRFDQLAREIISGTIEGRSEGSTLAFVQLKEGRPENLAASTARAFLGVRLECAQCHNHPFASWKREDFWKLAAFYGGIEADQFGNITSPLGGSGKIRIPDTETEVIATVLLSSEPLTSSKGTPRASLADWVTSKDNPYFARAVVNRVWSHFFGIGIVDPIDDFDARNPPSHPELLDEMAQAFVVQNFDLKFLVRAITRSKAYQLTSRRTHTSQKNPQMFSRMIVKGLTSDQLFDSLLWATGGNEQQVNSRGVDFGEGGQRARFRELFGQQVGSPGEVQTSILQSLLLMNGSFVDQATSPQASMTLSALIEAPFFSNAERLELLYMAALARPPRPEEATELLKYIEEKSPDRDWKQSLGDVYWALLNSSEFLLNH